MRVSVSSTASTGTSSSRPSLAASGQRARRILAQHLPVISVGKWPEGLSRRREDLYGDDGR
jgi:hypothetical protein